MDVRAVTLTKELTEKQDNDASMRLQGFISVMSHVCFIRFTYLLTRYTHPCSRMSSVRSLKLY